MHTVFRICNIKPMSENNRLFEVDLILTSENDQDLRAITDHVREETDEFTGWFRLGQVLGKMGQFDKAEQVYTVLLEQAIDECEKAPIHHQLRWVKSCKEAYKEAITFHGKALDIRLNTLPPNHPDLGASDDSIGTTCENMGDLTRAPSFYERSVDSAQHSISLNHPNHRKSRQNLDRIKKEIVIFFHRKLNPIFECKVCL